MKGQENNHQILHRTASCEGVRSFSWLSCCQLLKCCVICVTVLSCCLY